MCSLYSAKCSFLRNLLGHVRLANARRGIAGALHLTTDGTFFQCLEGQRETVSVLIESIDVTAATHAATSWIAVIFFTGCFRNGR
ncbi:MAG: hypothetical protein EOO38_24335 [Cytophagaceae bacterium]|nr:MAG: hypothetical protein EOO38_24335 [Cytophagaceae bacterium]